MQTAASTIRAQPFMASKTTAQSARKQTVAKAVSSSDDMQSRRAALALAAAAVIGFGSVEMANAGMISKNGSAASQSGYIMEGTKKMGIDATRKAKLLKNAREAATKQAAK